MAIRITPVLLAPLCFCLNASFIATAATIPVTSLADDGPGTLRDAIVHAANGDTIVFSVTGRIVLKTGELRVTTNVRILGPGPGNLSVDGNSESRVFHITPVTDVLISGLTITNGLHRGDTFDGGGGILNQYASLTVSN